WKLVKSGSVAAGAIREEYILSHGVVLHALGAVGAYALAHHPDDWQDIIPRLKEVDWSKGNVDLWEGRALNFGRITKSTTSIMLTANAIKQHLGLSLTHDEQELERRFKHDRK